MTDDDLIARLRGACYLAFDDGTNDYGTAPDAADRIEALLKERDALKVDLEKMGRTAVKINETLGWEAGRREAAEARAERLEAALQFYSCKDGCNDCSENERDLIGCGWTARAALKGADHE